VWKGYVYSSYGNWVGGAQRLLSPIGLAAVAASRALRIHYDNGILALNMSWIGKGTSSVQAVLAHSIFAMKIDMEPHWGGSLASRVQTPLAWRLLPIQPIPSIHYLIQTHRLTHLRDPLIDLVLEKFHLERRRGAAKGIRRLAK
jgi:hypothetical protein